MCCSQTSEDRFSHDEAHLISEIMFLFGKHKVLLIDRTNQSLVNITYSWHTFGQHNLFFGQHNLFLAYILSTKPIHGICFVHNHCASHIIWFNINKTYCWHTFWSQYFIKFNITYSWHKFCHLVKPAFVFRRKKIRNYLIDCSFLFLNQNTCCGY